MILKSQTIEDQAPDLLEANRVFSHCSSVHCCSSKVFLEANPVLLEAICTLLHALTRPFY